MQLAQQTTMQCRHKVLLQQPLGGTAKAEFTASLKHGINTASTLKSQAVWHRKQEGKRRPTTHFLRAQTMALLSMSCCNCCLARSSAALGTCGTCSAMTDTDRDKNEGGCRVHKQGLKSCWHKVYSQEISISSCILPYSLHFLPRTTPLLHQVDSQLAFMVVCCNAKR